MTTAKLYLRKIREGAMSPADVPLRWRDEVSALLLDIDCGEGIECE